MTFDSRDVNVNGRLWSIALYNRNIFGDDYFNIASIVFVWQFSLYYVFLLFNFGNSNTNMYKPRSFQKSWCEMWLHFINLRLHVIFFFVIYNKNYQYFYFFINGLYIDILTLHIPKGTCTGYFNRKVHTICSCFFDIVCFLRYLHIIRQ